MKKYSLLLNLSAMTIGNLALLFCASAQPTTNKTPDGLATIVAPNDPILAPAPAPVSFTGQVDSATVKAAAQLMDDSLFALAQKSDDKDTQWFEDGVWHNGAEKVWQVQSGPALGAAMLWKWREKHDLNLSAADKAKQSWLLKVAVETFDRQLKDHAHADGSMDREGTHIQFFATDLGLAYLTLGDALDDATKARWRAALKGVTDFLISTGDLPDPNKPAWKATDGWYTNGNVELYEAELAFLTWNVTGEQKYKDLFETQWKHTLSPNQERWKGYGLFYLKPPTKPDGADGAGFVTEAEPEPGFDPEYTQLQLSDVARLYLESGDPRALRLMNVLLGALMPRVDEKSWVLDATYGSRHSTRPPFATSGLAVAAWLGNRRDLAPAVAGQFENAIAPAYLNNAMKNQGAPGLYRGYGVDVAVILQADLASQ